MSAGKLPAWWLYPTVEVELSPLARCVRGISAHNHDPVVDQGTFAWGNPGTETGHTLDTAAADRAPTVDGTGNYLAFLRVELIQTLSTADINLSRTYKLQYRKNGGTWTDVTAASSNVRVIADSNITDGAATTDRISGSGNTFQAGEYDEGNGVLDAITWASGATRHTEVLWSLEFVDADLVATDLIEFRVIESSGTLLNNSATADFPGLTWSAAGDTTAPTLSSPQAGTPTATGATGAGVTTDEDNGTLYWVLVPDGDAPSAAQVKAGQQSSGAAAVDSGSQAVTGTGAQVITGVDGGSAGTHYELVFAHEDAATNMSATATVGLTTLAVVSQTKVVAAEHNSSLTKTLLVAAECAALIVATNVAAAEHNSAVSQTEAVTTEHLAVPSRSLLVVSEHGGLVSRSIIIPAEHLALVTVTNEVASEQQLGVASGRSYLSLPGEAGDHASTPDTAVLDITGDIDLRADVALDDWQPDDHKMLLAKWVETGDERSYMLYVGSEHQLTIGWCEDGASGTATFWGSQVTNTWPAFSRRCVRVTLDVDNGSGGFTIRFYEAGPGNIDSGPWTLIAEETWPFATTSIHAGTAPLLLGTFDGVIAQNAWSGKFYRAQIRSGIDGTVVLDVDFSKQSTGDLSFDEDANSAVVTVEQSGSPAAGIAHEDIERPAEHTLSGFAQFVVTSEHAGPVAQTNEVASEHLGEPVSKTNVVTSEHLESNTFEWDVVSEQLGYVASTNEVVAEHEGETPVSQTNEVASEHLAEVSTSEAVASEHLASVATTEAVSSEHLASEGRSLDVDAENLAALSTTELVAAEHLASVSDSADVDAEHLASVSESNLVAAEHDQPAGVVSQTNVVAAEHESPVAQTEAAAAEHLAAAAQTGDVDAEHLSSVETSSLVAAEHGVTLVPISQTNEAPAEHLASVARSITVPAEHDGSVRPLASATGPALYELLIGTAEPDPMIGPATGELMIGPSKNP